MQWQPIETAPKDGTQIIILACGMLVEVACWAPSAHRDYPWAVALGTEYYDRIADVVVTEVNGYAEDAVTHWMPMPEAPQHKENDNA